MYVKGNRLDYTTPDTKCQLGQLDEQFLKNYAF